MMGLNFDPNAAAIEHRITPPLLSATTLPADHHNYWTGFLIYESLDGLNMHNIMLLIDVSWQDPQRAIGIT